MKSVVIGATAGIGRELTNSLASEGHSLLITGRDIDDLSVCVQDLQITYGVKVESIVIDASKPSDYADSLEKAAVNLGEINFLFLPIGVSSEQDTGGLDFLEVSEIINTNLLAVISAVRIFQPYFMKTGSAGIIGFSSVAATRGRDENVIYSAAKRALESYFESLRFSFHGSKLFIQLYKLGYVDTYQSYGKMLTLPKVSPSKVSSFVISNLQNGSLVCYYPRYWAPIALILRSAPFNLFRKLVKRQK